MIGPININKLHPSGVISICLLLAACESDNQSSMMSVEADDKVWVQRDLLVTETEDPVVENFHYDMNGERVYIEAKVYPPGEALTDEHVSSAPTTYFGLGLIGLSREEEETKDHVGAQLVDRSGEYTLSSRLLRESGSVEHAQPFGNHVLKMVIEEAPYELERRSGLPFFGDVEIEQVGDGHVRLELVNDAGTVLFTLRDDYVENSADYKVMFTPDGRYLLITLPDKPESAAAQLPGGHRLIMVGDLPITWNKRDIIAELLLTGEEREVFRRERMKRQQFEQGLISPDEFYGEIYTRAYRKIFRCVDVQDIVGQITTLTVQDEVMDFGQPDVVGKVFTFDYVADTSTGELQVTVLEPEEHDKWASAYRNYLETIDVRSSTGTRFANCPD